MSSEQLERPQCNALLPNPPGLCALHFALYHATPHPDRHRPLLPSPPHLLSLVTNKQTCNDVCCSPSHLHYLTFTTSPSLPHLHYLTFTTLPSLPHLHHLTFTTSPSSLSLYLLTVLSLVTKKQLCNDVCCLPSHLHYLTFLSFPSSPHRPFPSHQEKSVQ